MRKVHTVSATVKIVTQFKTKLDLSRRMLFQVIHRFRFVTGIYLLLIIIESNLRSLIWYIS